MMVRITEVCALVANMLHPAQAVLAGCCTLQCLSILNVTGDPARRLCNLFEAATTPALARSRLSLRALQSRRQVLLSNLLHALLLQEQAQAARKRAAGTMDEYTFIAEDAAAADSSIPAIQQVSAEELYRRELAEEMQVALQYTINQMSYYYLHSGCTEKLVCLSTPLLCKIRM